MKQLIIFLLKWIFLLTIILFSLTYALEPTTDGFVLMLFGCTWAFVAGMVGFLEYGDWINYYFSKLKKLRIIYED